MSYVYVIYNICSKSLIKVVHFCHIDEVFVLLLQGDNVRGRALEDMMDGVLQVKKEDILKMVGPFLKH